ncbi:hypothetical protein BC829DRAFT_159065 [Chytridium lagenaria]|nr:hypothetical protein BC829DRAFT_159065 [Chytridium lagenaria]
MFSLSSRLGGVSAYSSHHPPSPYPSRNHHNLPPPSPSSFSEQPFGSLVGSYEESILSGRMSTLPSRPIPFLAEIGVIGFGKGVKARLKCPPHVNLSFPAYFYDLLDDETPSTPYVGMVDVEGLTGLVLKKDGGGNGTPNYTPVNRMRRKLASLSGNGREGTGYHIKGKFKL